MDRAVLILLPSIKEDHRIPESKFYEQVREARPGILGGLLNCVATALDNIGGVDRYNIPRMADFTIFASAAVDAMGWTQHTFVDAYFENRKHAHEIILENSPLAAASMKQELPIEGSPIDVLQKSIDDAGTKDYFKQKGFPKSVRGFSIELDRIAPNLLEVGIFVTRSPSRSKDRVLRVKSTRTGRMRTQKYCRWSGNKKPAFYVLSVPNINKHRSRNMTAAKIDNQFIMVMDIWVLIEIRDALSEYKESLEADNRKFKEELALRGDDSLADGLYDMIYSTDMEVEESGEYIAEIDRLNPDDELWRTTDEKLRRVRNERALDRINDMEYLNALRATAEVSQAP